MILRLLLVSVVVALAMALPATTQATSINEVRKLTASDPEDFDHFGSVAVSSDTAVAGASGVFPGGAAYIYQRDEGGQDDWGEVTKLTASDAPTMPSVNHAFGGSVAVSGDTVVVGARFANAGGSETGAAYVFQRDEGGPGNWGEVTKLTASDAQPADSFGRSVAVSGDIAVVGAPDEDAAGNLAGAVYVFQRDEGGADNWGEVTKLTASDAQSAAWFGFSVAVSGDTALAGAPGEDAAASFAGAAYVFQRDEGGVDNWGEVTRLTASNAEPEDFFGLSVAVSSDTSVVGAHQEDAGGSGAGAAYVFQRDQAGADNWGEVTKLTASDAEADGLFGASVAVSSDRAVVGAGGEDAGGDSAGAAYIFQRNQGGQDNWGEVSKLNASDAQAEDFFGGSVAVNGDTAVVGAPFEDAESEDAGAAYVFDLLQPKRTPIGDANCDGNVNAVDATLVLQLVAGLIGPLDCQDAADVNGDGEVTSVDAALILQFTAGLLDSLYA